MDWAKGVAGKAATGVIVLAVFVAGLAWFQADPTWRSSVVHGVGKSVGWIAGVAALPWLCFWLIGRVARSQSNAAGACLVGGLTLLELVALLWLFAFAVTGGAAWAMIVAAVLVAGAYNTLACDWIAEQVSG